ncbi:MAG: sucrase ferredoxin [Leptolyngbya sp. SIOISBB]|nr:sucrase ferredoxin [Leptolyngbya sp. SIOISBB]
MLTQDVLTECRFCSEVSKANGEDPIGTAGTADHWLVMELPQPWVEQTFKEDPQIAPLLELFKQLVFKHGVMLRPILIAPDSEYSQPGKTRVIYYHRPEKQFAQFAKQEYLVPEADATRLATAILQNLMKQPNELESFAGDRIDTRHIREVLVCTHGNVDVACAKFGFPIYKKLRDEYTDHVRVWRCSHFGGHKFAPTLVDLPDGRFWGHLEPDMLDLLMHHDGDVAGLRSHYRGWAGLSKFEQIAEREIWMQVGWDWLDYDKSGRTLRKGLKGIKRYLYPLLRLIPLKRAQLFVERWTGDATWADVQIQFSSADRTISGTYQTRVEAAEPVITAGNSPQSGEAIALKPSPQYRVGRLSQLS